MYMHAEAAASRVRNDKMMRKSEAETKKDVLILLELQKQKQAKLIKAQNDKLEELKAAEEERGDA